MSCSLSYSSVSSKYSPQIFILLYFNCISDLRNRSWWQYYREVKPPIRTHYVVTHLDISVYFYLNVTVAQSQF
jgi:hypothetical protein